jgi:hypothetical protein
MFALDTAIGPVRRSSSMATGCSGIRSATVPTASPRSQDRVEGWRTMSVRPPGQNARTSSRTVGTTRSTKPSSVRQEPMSTGTGMSRPRPFVAARSRTADGLKASAPMP